MVNMRHLEMQELLGLRDGEGSAYAGAHLQSCEACRHELERLHRIRAELKALPGYTPPRELWPRISAEVRRRGTRRWWLSGAAGLAAAAALIGFLVLKGNGPVVDGRLEPAANVWAAEAASGDLGPFIARSQELESLLRTYTPQYRVYDAPTALAVSALEDRIDILDRMLYQSRAVGVERQLLVNLWDDRVATLETLVGIQFSEEQPLDKGGPVWR